jgi:hypothetical protein|tara:strand:- start:168 stop:392 length:225 start_codon:yes stop_codon:yes gene_type:complete
MAEENNVITIDGNEYNPADLNLQQHYFISQINDLQFKRNKLQFDMDQVNVALESFTNNLIESVTEQPKKEKVNE